MNNHTALVNSLRLRLSEMGCISMLNVTGMFWRKTETGYVPVRVGNKGWPDIIGFTKSGQFFGVEAKTGSGVLSPEQRNFRTVATANNAIFIEARSVADLEVLK